MSLKAFHIFFVTASVLMSLGVGGWAADRYLKTLNAESLGLAILCFALGAGLIVYGFKVYRKLSELDAR